MLRSNITKKIIIISRAHYNTYLYQVTNFCSVVFQFFCVDRHTDIQTP